MRCESARARSLLLAEEVLEKGEDALARRRIRAEREHDAGSARPLLELGAVVGPKLEHVLGEHLAGARVARVARVA